MSNEIQFKILCHKERDLLIKLNRAIFKQNTIPFVCQIRNIKQTDMCILIFYYVNLNRYKTKKYDNSINKTYDQVKIKTSQQKQNESN